MIALVLSKGCRRTWDFRWSWYTDESTYQVDQGGRALGKTVGITMRAFAFPFNFEGQKMLLTAPELNHLRPLTDAIEQRLDSTRLIRELRPIGKGGGINKQPHWQAKFTNNAQLVSRLPNKDGKGVKGQQNVPPVTSCHRSAGGEGLTHRHLIHLEIACDVAP